MNARGWAANRGIIPWYAAGVLSRAVAAWKADRYDPTLDALVDLTGNAHHARFGSTVGADTNDPLRLPFAGKAYLYVPGAGVDGASTPSSPAIDITGAIEIRAHIRPVLWATTTARHVVSRYTTAGDNRSWRLFQTDSGLFGFQWSENGTSAYATINNPQPFPFADGEAGWIRVTFETDNGNGQRVAQWYTSVDGVLWTPLGSAMVQAGTTSLASVNSPVEVGVQEAGRNFLGDIYRVQVFDGLADEGGNLVADFNPADSQEPHTSFASSTTGETWTINRSTTGRKAVLVDRPLLLLGTDDYLVVPYHANLDAVRGQPLTAALAFRRYPTSAYEVFIGNRAHWESAANAGWNIRNINNVGAANATAQVADGSVATARSGTWPSGVAAIAAAVIESNETLAANLAGVSIAPTSIGGTAPLTAGQPLVIGARSTLNSDFASMEFVGAAIFREALTADDLSRLAREFGVAA